MIGACRDMTDYRRASEWIEATERYCDRQSLRDSPRGPDPSSRVAPSGARRNEPNRSSKGDRRSGRLTPSRRGRRFYAIGLPPAPRGLRGHRVGSGEALPGRSPQPALALVRLAAGKTKAAAAASTGRWPRRRGIAGPARVSCLRRWRSRSPPGTTERARSAVNELAETVKGYPSPALEGAPGRARPGARGRGRRHGGRARASGGIRGWREVGAPWVARARAVLSRALRALDDEDDADLELHAALDEFRRLGARVDLEAAERERQDAGAELARHSLL